MSAMAENISHARTQDIPEMSEREFYKLDPDYIDEPEGTIQMTRPVLWSLIALRVYLIGLMVLTGYRFAQYAHWVK